MIGGTDAPPAPLGGATGGAEGCPRAPSRSRPPPLTGPTGTTTSSIQAPAWAGPFLGWLAQVFSLAMHTQWCTRTFCSKPPLQSRISSCPFVSFGLFYLIWELENSGEEHRVPQDDPARLQTSKVMPAFSGFLKYFGQEHHSIPIRTSQKPHLICGFPLLCIRSQWNWGTPSPRRRRTAGSPSGACAASA